MCNLRSTILRGLMLSIIACCMVNRAAATSGSHTDTLQSGNTIHITADGNVILSSPNAKMTVDSVSTVWSGKPKRARATTDIQRRVLSVESVLPGAYHKPDIIPYTGKGVVVGIIDCGIDPNHIAFQNSDRTASRVAQYIVTESAEETGSSLTAIKYEGSQLASVPVDVSENGHGTHTASTAAGSFGRGQAAPYSGMAPDADLVLVNIGEAMYDDEIIYGMRAVTDYATSHDKRAVMNLSLGYNLGPHDGTDPVGLVSSEVGKKGVTSCFSAGNDGLSRMSLQRNFANDTVPLGSLFFKWNHGTMETCVMEAWSHDTKEFEISVIVAQMWPPQILYRSPYFKASQVKEAGGKLQLSGGDAPLCPQIGELITAAGEVELEMGIYQPNGRFFASLSGKLPDWVEGRNLLGFIVRSPQGADVRVYTEPIYCTFGTCEIDELTTATSAESISDFCDAYGVVSVGSTNARAEYTTLDGTHHTLNEDFLGPLNSPSLTSSYGTGFNSSGYILPHVMAPGVHVMAALNGHVPGIEQIAVAQEQYQGQRYLWGEFSGTSMSSPAAAGVIALWLEAFPTLTYEQLMETLRESSNRSWLGSHPERAAWGQIDAYEGLKYIFRTFSVDQTTVDNEGDFKLIGRYLDHNTLEITSSRSLSNGMLTLYSTDGRMLERRNIYDSTFTVVLPDTPGIYILSVTDTRGKGVMKVTV